MNTQNTFCNPILPGFYPDPSICKVKDDYYLVTSTFTYFPGVPIFHSKDLIHWEQIGNVLTRRSQVELMGSEQSRGIFAPTLRYHDGVFYMITTNVSNLGNFIVTATDPKGPWSDPYPLGSSGIDPSLFFDDDGKCYYCGTQERREGSKYFGDNEIYIQELDLTTMKLVGESYPAWHGALREMEWPEGPHLYKKNGWYYLLISEAGTDYHHAVSIARSKSLFTPFQGNPGNPILTHRHLGRKYPIVNVGHPDIVETDEGEWWMVLLASRTYGGYFRNLGRETFLVPFIWEQGWPIVNPGKGIVEDCGIAPNLPTFSCAEIPEKEDFDSTELPPRFLYLRNPVEENYSLTKRPGFLTMQLSPVDLSMTESPSFVCVRQQHFSYIAETSMDFTPVSNNECAGIAINQSQSSYLALIVTRDKDESCIQLWKTFQDKKSILAEERVPFTNDIRLRFVAHGQNLQAEYDIDGQRLLLLSDIDTRFLNTDSCGGFVGCCIGLYASSHGEPSTNSVAFDYLTYKGL